MSNEDGCLGIDQGAHGQFLDLRAVNGLRIELPVEVRERLEFLNLGTLQLTKGPTFMATHYEVGYGADW